MCNAYKINSSHKKILILNEQYLPGYKSGGPVRTVVNLTSCFGDRYNFNIICLDRDLGDTEPYPNVKINEWTKVGNARVLYVKKYTPKLILKYVRENDLLYCCGGFCNYSVLSMLLKRFGLIKKPVFVASMGVFSSGALAIKSIKKKAFLFIGKLLGLFNSVSWSVSTSREEQELKKALGEKVKTFIAENLPRNADIKRVPKVSAGELRIIFLSRISPMKNLEKAIEIVKRVKTRVVFDVYGNLEDQEYWAKCLKELEGLPSNVKWNYCGVVDSQNVLDRFAQYDVFLFPTLGENFGHVISEAMLAGCIPVISDTTPWQDLEEKGCGYVFPLSDSVSFVNALEKIANATQEELSSIRDNVFRYIQEHNKRCVSRSGYLQIFDFVEG